MSLPWDEVRYVGEETPISCPSATAILSSYPTIRPPSSPVCWVHGKISIEDGRLKVTWDEWEASHSQWSLYGLYHHMNDLCQRRAAPSPARQEEFRELKRKYSAYGKIIRPDS
jgi:hypothetical protein